MASILGREVPLQLLQGLWEGPGDVEEHLPLLQQLEFLYEQVAADELRYLFKHALTQEVAYASVLPSRRQVMHAAVGQALEAFYAERLDDVVDQLAYHYGHSAEAAKAVAYLTQLAVKAVRSYAHVEAVAAYQEALAHVEHLPAVQRDRRRLEVLLQQAFSLSILGRFRDIADSLLPQQELLERLQEPALAGPYYFRLGLTAVYLGALDQAIEHAHRALAAAQACHDQATMGMAYRLLAWVHNVLGCYRQAMIYGQEAVSLLERAEAWHWLGLAYWDIGSSAAFLGEVETASQAFAQTYTLGREHDDMRLQHFGEGYGAWVTIMQGEWETGIAACQHILERSPDPIVKARVLLHLGIAYLEQGNPAQAILLLRQSFQQYSQFRVRYPQGLSAALLGEALLADNRLKQAQHMAHQGLEVSRDAAHPYGVGLAQRVLGRIAHARGDDAIASRYLQEALQTFVAIEAQYEVGRTHLLLAELAHAQDDQDTLSTHLRAAHHLFTTLRVPKYAERTAALARRFKVTLPSEEDAPIV